MSNYNDFDLDIRSTHNSGPVDPQSVIPVTVTCNCTYGPICHATELLCTPGNICDITISSDTRRTSNARMPCSVCRNVRAAVRWQGQWASARKYKRSVLRFPPQWQIATG